MSDTVFVTNLNYRTTERQLANAFADTGEVRSVKIPTDPATGKSRGFAFVKFSRAEEAEWAVQVYNGRKLAGRVLTVRPAGDRRSTAPTNRPPRLHPIEDESWDGFGDDDEQGKTSHLKGKPRGGKRSNKEWRRMRRNMRSL